MAVFQRFAREVQLPAGEFTPWEDELRQKLRDTLSILGRPFPLVDWIEHRIGEEVEVVLDTEGSVVLQLRHGTRDGHGMDQRRSEAFFAKLPADSFLTDETKLRGAIFRFLACWTRQDLATLEDMSRDPNISTLRGVFIPKVVTLKEWIEERMGEEVYFETTALQRDVVHVSPAAQGEVMQKHREAVAAGPMKRKAAAEERQPHPMSAAAGAVPPPPDAPAKKPRRAINLDFSAPNANPKTELNNFCQAMINRSIKPGDIEYKVTPAFTKYQATVTLECFSPPEQFMGQVCKNPKTAEGSAAQAALMEHQAEIFELNNGTRPATALAPTKPLKTPLPVGQNTSTPRERQDAEAEAMPEENEPPQHVDPEPKDGNYMNVLKRLSKRVLGHCTGSQIVYEIIDVGESEFLGTVRLNFLEGSEFTGDVCPSKTKARASAAKHAVQGVADQIAELNAELEQGDS